jgi:hypothetical protein
MGTPLFALVHLAGGAIQTQNPGKDEILFIKKTTYSCATGGLTSGAHLFNVMPLKRNDLTQQTVYFFSYRHRFGR